MIGLGVMGRNLLLNMADHGFAVIGFDKDTEKAKALETSASAGTRVKGVVALEEMISQLQRPRRVMMLVPAGKPVDDVLESLKPLLEPGDIVIDGGNSHYTDTLRRVTATKEAGFHFMGVGVSGGEQGARTGPSIMPGGDQEAYAHVKPMLEAISAKVDGEPCVAYLGKGAAGHYVKMVHNGIEYAIMQLISESYRLLKAAGLDNDQLHEVYKKWNEGDMQSFLLEITADIFLQPDDKSGLRLIDVISDKAGSKGTGKWTSQDAMDLGVPATVIDTAVSMRTISAFRDERVQAAAIYKEPKIPVPADQQLFISQVQDALQFATIICYAQGMAMLHSASSALDMDIPLPQALKVWRGGCIIRSALLGTFYNAMQQSPGLPNLLLNATVADIIKGKEHNMRAVIVQAAQAGLPAAGFMAALSYFDAYRSEKLPTNLVQAQRDYFGAHTYQRIDMPGSFHTSWQHH
ncbi:6-phosphogluconate dehydrogenase, NADP(+)-dependent, decarboxylating [Chitinophaga cymbidii]|uniref:6-phosphogluconate dehydrogenase, decarboxylating n=2 Tax=Chitinophaga cymbidii TaxID=1096750 RepID=A0A512RER8_9BACT|nr:6-phosphogluconate dehydrogenase, NADP(+)-dependent, decarboxylating [Chitinophaga cymbidii]